MSLRSILSNIKNLELQIRRNNLEVGTSRNVLRIIGEIERLFEGNLDEVEFKIKQITMSRPQFRDNIRRNEQGEFVEQPIEYGNRLSQKLLDSFYGLDSRIVKLINNQIETDEEYKNRLILKYTNSLKI